MRITEYKTELRTEVQIGVQTLEPRPGYPRLVCVTLEHRRARHWGAVPQEANQPSDEITQLAFPAFLCGLSLGGSIKDISVGALGLCTVTSSFYRGGLFCFRILIRSAFYCVLWNEYSRQRVNLCVRWGPPVNEICCLLDFCFISLYCFCFFSF